MAHPYAEHREHKASKSRVRNIMKSGDVPKHDDAKEDKKLFAGLMREHEVKMHGAKSGARLDKYARGGRTKGKTNVNIVIAMPHGGGEPPVVPPMGPASAPMMRPAVPSPGPGAGLPPRPPAGAPPLMRKSGGRANISGLASKENISKWSKRAEDNSYARGGATHGYPKLDAGAGSGEGRLEKKQKYGKRARG